MFSNEDSLVCSCCSTALFCSTVALISKAVSPASCACTPLKLLLYFSAMRSLSSVTLSNLTYWARSSVLANLPTTLKLSNQGRNSK